MLSFVALLVLGILAGLFMATFIGKYFAAYTKQ